MKLILIIISTIHCFLVMDVQGINGGQLATIGQFKYIVSIQVDHGCLGFSYCTGAIIHERYILTAAHCFTKKDKKNPKGRTFDKTKVVVYANVIGTEKFYRKKTHAIKKQAVRAHFVPQYFKDGIEDIALLELDSDLTFCGGLLEKLKLPVSLDRGGYDIDSKEDAVLAGYGKTKIGKDDNYELKWIDMKVVHSRKCLNYYDNVDVNSERNVCAVADEAPKAGCKGDSGAPLVVHHNDARETKTAIAVFIMSGPCSKNNNHPGIFIRITHYLPFIRKVTHEHSDDKVKIETYDFNNKLV